MVVPLPLYRDAFREQDVRKQAHVKKLLRQAYMQWDTIVPNTTGLASMHNMVPGEKHL